MLLGRSINGLDEQALQTLKDRGVEERRDAEYKRDLPAEDHESRREFLADVSSFANAVGGYLFFGITAEGGLPVAVLGVTATDIDHEILRLESLMRDGIQPRLQGAIARKIPLSSGRSVIAIFVPQSWSKPHVVNFQKHWRFYSRNSAGKYPLDVGEVRGAVLQSNSMSERLREFRDFRIASISTNETPVRLEPGARVTMHVVPYKSLQASLEVSLEVVMQKQSQARPIGGLNGAQYNFDGALFIGESPAKEPYGYVQVFRTGVIELVDTLVFDNTQGKTTIHAIALEKELIEAADRFVGLQQELELGLPVAIMVTLIGVRGYGLVVSSNLLRTRLARSRVIDRDILRMPEVLLDGRDLSVARALRPAFDALWNAAGWPRSLTYDDRGEWGSGPNKE